LRDGTQRATYWQGERCEHPTARVLHDWARAGATAFFDIGANYGFYSFMMTARHPALDVFAFEPNPRTFAHLHTIVTENRLTRVHAINSALGDTVARLPLHPGEADSGHSTLLPHPELTGAAYDVEVQPFDDWRRARGLALPDKPAWIAKIDV